MTCREEQKKKNPGATVAFAEFGKQCGEKWKAMTAKEKKRFEDMAVKDKARYDKEMTGYKPSAGGDAPGKRKRKEKKDPNAPKRALSAFFCFCAEERPKVRAKNPDWPIGEVGKELGKRWGLCTNKAKFEALANKDKERYAKEIAVYKKTGGGSPKKGLAKAPAAKKAKQASPPEDDDDDDDEDDDDDDDDE